MLFESTQARVLIALAIPVIILSQRLKFSMVTLFTQIILYLALAYNADCLVTGQCKTWAWLVILLPLINTMGYLFFVDKLKLDAPIQLPVPRVLQPAPTAPTSPTAPTPSSPTETAVPTTVPTPLPFGPGPTNTIQKA
jgi:hypothetical protein